MPIELLYQVLKDFAALAKMREIDPLDPGTLDLKLLISDSILDKNIPEDSYVWCAPQKLYSRTEAPNSTYEIVWIANSLKRHKRKIVRFTHDGKLDLILIRKK